MATHIRVILIDPVEKTITEHTIPDNLQAYYKLIGCELVESVRPTSLKKGNSLYVDEERTFKDDLHYFDMEGWGTLVGKAIVLRHNADGESVSTTETVGSITRLVTFE